MQRLRRESISFTRSERDAYLPTPTMRALTFADVEQAVLWTAVLAVLLAIGIYVVGQIRAKALQQELSASELMTKFREMHSRGVLSDEEFRTIKTTLTDRLQSELRDTGGTP